jgi:two-component system, cell cycle sensor histidine kinase and response regulator CckA
MTRKRILAVEDDELFADYLKITLEDLGYDVLGTVALAEDAVVRAGEEKPDLILMDIELAGEMNGIAAARRILSVSDVPIVYVTGHFEPAVLKKAGLTAPYGYVVKPTTRGELAAAVEMAFSRRSVELKLKESENRLKIALASARMGVWEWDAMTDKILWSPECHEILGAYGTVPTFQSFLGLIHREDKQAVVGSFDRLSTGLAQFSTAFRYAPPAEKVRWVAASGQGRFDDTGTLTGMIGTVQDITDHKQLEVELSATNARLELAQKIASIGTFDRDLRTNIITTTSGMEAVYGESSAAKLGTYDEWRERVHPADRARVEQQVKDTATGNSDYDTEFRVVWPDGSIQWVEAHGAVVRDGAGQPERLVGIAMKITKRKEIEEKLLISDFALASSISAIGLFHLDGTVRYVNESFLRLWGYENEDEVIGRHISEFALVGEAERAIRALESGQNHVGESQAKKRDGSPFFVDVSTNVVRTREGTPVCFMASFIDTTDRKKMMEALRDSEEKYRTVFATENDALLLIDQETGAIVEVNDAACSLYGYSCEEMLRMRNIDVSAEPGETARKTREFQGRIAIRLHRKKDGTIFPVDISSSLFRVNDRAVILASVRDMTVHQSQQHALRSSEKRFRSLFETSRDAILLVNQETGRIIAANPAACTLYGYTEEELLSLKTTDVSQEPDRTEDAIGHSVSLVPLRLHRKKDGTVFPVEISGGYFEEDDRHLHTAFIRDITDRNRMEEQLRQAQKMEAIGTLAGGVAHDFNNLLTVILGFAQLIQMSTDKESETRPYVDQIVKSSNRAADLTQSLLAFSRKQRIELAPHPVNEVVRKSATLLGRLLPEDILVVLNLAPEDLGVRIDITQIEQVLLNLATNARDAMPYGGSLTITTRKTLIDEDFIKSHAFGHAGDYVKLSITDTGIGMDPPTLEHIFEPFYTTKGVGKGTGLGLASTFGIVKQHSGYIAVASIPQQGTTFEIYLPLIDEAPQHITDILKESPRGSETILIVEDDPAVRQMLTTMLTGRGYTIIEAGDGQMALAVYADHRDEIDLLILDVVMPGRNGKDVFDEIVRTDPGVKAIFMSGYTGDVVLTKGIHRQTVDFLQKPVSVTGLLTMVRTVLDR